MNPRQFLQVGGAVLVVVGVLGMVGVLGPTPQQSLFGATWWFDNVENWTHLVLGVAGLVVAYAFPAALQKTVAMLVGLLAVVAGLYSLLVGTMLAGANLENPADTVLHLVVGAWALWAVFGNKK